MHPFQAMFNGMKAEWQAERAEAGMTLGDMIDALAALDGDRLVDGLGELISYRGYYEDLAFAPTTETRTVADLLAECREAMGRTFEGYKGGDFLMGENTPLWLSAYGNTSQRRIVGLDTESEPITARVEVIEI